MGFLQDAISEARIVSKKELNESWIQDIKETTDYLWTWYKEGMVSDVAKDIYNDAVDKVADKYSERSRAFYEAAREVFSDNLDKYYKELKASVAERLEKGYADNKEKINKLIDDRIERLENE